MLLTFAPRWDLPNFCASLSSMDHFDNNDSNYDINNNNDINDNSLTIRMDCHINSATLNLYFIHQSRR
jgi:hypothetical protein